MDRSARSLTRRRFTRLLGLSVLALPAALKPRGADAIGWCRRDPVLTVDGKTGHFFVSAPEEILSSVTGPNRYRVYYPSAATSVAITSTENGFGRGESTSVSNRSWLAKTARGCEIEIRVYVPASGSLPILVEWAPGDGSVVTATASGFTNQWVALRTVL